MRYGDATEQSLDLRLDLVVPHRSLERMLCPPPQCAQRLAAYHTLAHQLGRGAGERPAPYQIVLVTPAAGEKQQGGRPGGAALPLKLGQGLPEMAGDHESPPGAALQAAPAAVAATTAASAEASTAAPGLAAKDEAAAAASSGHPGAAAAATPRRSGGRTPPVSPQLFTPAAMRLRAAVKFATGAAQE